MEAPLNFSEPLSRQTPSGQPQLEALKFASDQLRLLACSQGELLLMRGNETVKAIGVGENEQASRAHV